MSREGAGDVVADRFDAQAPDGTTIAIWVEGEGPAMVLAHGSLQDHVIAAALVAELREGFTTFAVGRRGFGASGDGANYAIEREFEDVAAVVDAVAARIRVLDGHAHIAHLTDPALVAAIVREFVASST